MIWKLEPINLKDKQWEMTKIMFFVIRADSEMEARMFARNHASSVETWWSRTTDHFWLDPKQVLCTPVIDDGPMMIVASVPRDIRVPL